MRRLRVATLDAGLIDEVDDAGTGRIEGAGRIERDARDVC